MLTVKIKVWIKYRDEYRVKKINVYHERPYVNGGGVRPTSENGVLQFFFFLDFDVKLPGGNAETDAAAVEAQQTA